MAGKRKSIVLTGALFFRASKPVLPVTAFHQHPDRPCCHTGIDPCPCCRATTALSSDARDMLRYDLAFVGQVDPSLVLIPSLFLPDGDRYIGKCTQQRWRSFGYGIEPTKAPIPIQTLPLIVKACADWVTYRHPRNENLVPDYNRLVPATLHALLTARSLREV